jgi:hypothetical protein
MVQEEPPKIKDEWSVVEEEEWNVESPSDVE